MLQDEILQGKREQRDRSNSILKSYNQGQETGQDHHQSLYTVRPQLSLGGLPTSLSNYAAGAEAFQLLSSDLTQVQNQKVASVP